MNVSFNIGSRQPRGAGIPVLVLALSLAAASRTADDLELWQGAFRTSAAWGAMEMIASGPAAARTAHVRFAINRQTVEADVRGLTVSPKSLSFYATLAGRQYQFAGARRDSQWTGTLRAASDPADQGTWRLVTVDLKNAAVNPSDLLPAATAPHPTGRTTLHWIDETRPELETRAADDHRELLVYVFYPSDRGSARAAYIPDAEVMRTAWGSELTDRLRQIGAHSYEGAPLARGAGRFPVIIFAPGGGQKTLSYTTLLEELASHGYVVAAIEPAHNAAAIQLPDGRIIRKVAATERGWDEPKTLKESQQLTHQIVVQWVRDMTFVLDRLTSLDRGDGPFSGRLDLSRAGAFGHSFGGLAAGTARLLDDRIRGAVNLDGNLTGTGFEYLSGSEAGWQPFLWIEGPYEPPSAAGLQQAGITEAQWQDMYADGDRQMRGLSAGGYRITMTRIGINHMDFSDQPFWDVGAAPEVRAGKLRTLALTRAYVLAFFDGSVKGRWERFSEACA